MNNKNFFKKELSKRNKIIVRILFLLSIIFLLFSAGSLYYINYDNNKGFSVHNNNTISNKIEPEPKENIDINYNPEEELKKIIKDTNIDINSLNKNLNLKHTKKITDISNLKKYIINIDNVGYVISFDKKDNKNIIKILYKNINVTNTRINKKGKTLEVIFEGKQEQNTYYEMEIILDIDLKNIDKFILLKNDILLHSEKI